VLAALMILKAKPAATFTIVGLRRRNKGTRCRRRAGRACSLGLEGTGMAGGCGNRDLGERERRLEDRRRVGGGESRSTPRRNLVAKTDPKEVVTLRILEAGSKLLPLGCPVCWILPLEWLRSESVWDHCRLGRLWLEDN
jgi:hypothetical protein